MNIFFFLLLSFLIVNPAYAHLHGKDKADIVYNYKSPDDITPYEAVMHDEEYFGCGGYLRAGFIQTKIRSVDTSEATAVGGELGCGYQLNAHIKAHLGAFAVLETGLNSQNEDNIHAEFFNNHKNSFFMLGEAVLTVSFKSFEAHLGRQNLDSPHMDSDDLRMVGNLFEAYLIDYHWSHELYTGAGFVRQAAGWENGGDLSHFIPIGEALGGKNSGAWVSWLAYAEEQVSANAWLYIIPDHLSIFYSEIATSNNITSNISYSTAFQYDWGQSIGEERLGDIEAHTVGFMASVSGYGLTITTAYNKNFGDTGAVASVGGGPFFTSMEDQTLDAAVGKNTQGILYSLEYAVNDKLSLGVAKAEFRADDRKDYRTDEINYFLNYNWNDKFSAEIMYAAIDDKNSSEDMDQIRAILTYRY